MKTVIYHNLTIFKYNVIYSAHLLRFPKVGKIFNIFRIIGLHNTRRTIGSQNTSRYTIIYDISFLTYAGCTTFAGTKYICGLASLGTGGWTLYQSAISGAICFRERETKNAEERAEE